MNIFIISLLFFHYFLMGYNFEIFHLCFFLALFFFFFNNLSVISIFKCFELFKNQISIFSFINFKNIIIQRVFSYENCSKEIFALNLYS